MWGHDDYTETGLGDGVWAWYLYWNALERVYNWFDPFAKLMPGAQPCKANATGKADSKKGVSKMNTGKKEEMKVYPLLQSSDDLNAWNHATKYR